jgi:cytochrome P450
VNSVSTGTDRSHPAQAGLPAPFDTAFSACPHAAFAELREQAPVVRVAAPLGSPIWLVTRADDVQATLADPRFVVGSAATPNATGQYGALGRSLINVDPPEHTGLRRLFAGAFSTGRTAGYRPEVERAAREVLDGALGGERIDFMAEVAKPFSFRVLCDTFGIPLEPRDELFTWMNAMFERSAHGPGTIADYSRRFSALVAEQIQDRSTASGPGRRDALSFAVEACRSTGAADEDELASLIAMVMLAGFDSTAQMLCICLLGLLEDTAVLDRVRTDPPLLGRAVEEFLRWDSPAPVAAPRRASVDAEIAGVRIPAGDRVLLSVASANRDPRRYEDPDRFDLDRDASRHLGFGHGPHRCLGAPLAKLELVVLLDEFLRRYPDARPALARTDLRWTGKYHRRLGTLPILVGARRPDAPGTARLPEG